MSDFEYRMLKRAGELQEQQERAARELQERQLSSDARAAELERQALLLGMQAVELLRRYSIPSYDIWERRPTGKKEEHTTYGLSGARTGMKDVMDYFYAGQGWQVYSVRLDRTWVDAPNENEQIGISDTGRTIRNPQLNSAQKLNGEKINGILSPYYEAPTYSINHMNGELFQNGIASLISGNGQYTGTVKITRL